MADFLRRFVPISAEDLQEIGVKARELLESFGKSFGINYAKCLVRSLLEDDDEDNSEWMLSRRPWDSVERTDMFSGTCYMLKSYGPGHFGEWKTKFIVEGPNYKVDVYKDEKSYRSGGNPKTISLLGYRLVEPATNYFVAILQKAAVDAGLDLDAALIASVTEFSHHSWALVNDHRVKYVMQLHEGKTAGCCCCCWKSTAAGDDAADYDPEKRSEWVQFFARCIEKADERSKNVKKSLIRQAFEKACESLKEDIEKLNDWEDDGSEEEMLTGLLMTALLSDLQINLMRGGMPLKLKLSMWGKVRGKVENILVLLVEEAWSKLALAEQKTREMLEKRINPVTNKIKGAIAVVKDKLKVLFVDKLADSIAKELLPLFERTINAMRQPIERGFQRGREVITEKVNVRSLPTDAAARNRLLDAVPRTAVNVKLIKLAAADVAEAVINLSLEQPGSISKAVEKLKIQLMAEDAILQLVDSAIFTIEQRLDDGMGGDSLMDQILQDYDCDAKYAAFKDFLKEAIREIYAEQIQKLVAAYIDPALKAVSDQIPDEVKEFIDLKEIVDGLVELIVNDQLNRVIDAAVPSRSPVVPVSITVEQPRTSLPPPPLPPKIHVKSTSQSPALPMRSKQSVPSNPATIDGQWNAKSATTFVQPGPPATFTSAMFHSRQS